LLFRTKKYLGGGTHACYRGKKKPYPQISIFK